MMSLPDLAAIEAAQQLIAGRLHRTPLVGSRSLSERFGAPLYLKLENWQKTGSFKPRGVLNKVAQLTPAERRRGLVTASAGNHAQALAWAAAAVDTPCTVVMPASAPQAKLDATRGYGATVVLEPNALNVFERAHALAAEQGLTFVPPFDDPAIVAGHGTIGLEILADLPDPGTLIVPIGGGGLIGGIALAVKQLRPQTWIIGVEPQGAAAMYRSRQTGSPVRLDRVQTIADGLAPPFVGNLPFAIVQQYVDEVVLVDDDSLRAAMALLLERCKILAEPSGAAAIAALLAGVAPIKPGAPVVALICGGNVDTARLVELLAR